MLLITSLIKPSDGQISLDRGGQHPSQSSDADAAQGRGYSCGVQECTYSCRYPVITHLPCESRW
jgi:hypothetical protein